MTDRHAGYLVTLDHDISVVVAEAILTALRMTRYVASVTPILAEPGIEHIARERSDLAWRKALGKLAAEGPGNA